VAIGLAIVLAAGCATSAAARRAQAAANRGEWDSAVAYYREALTRSPKRVDLQIALERATREASSQHVQRAKILEAQDQLAAAANEYRLAIEFDPSNTLAVTKALEMDRRIRERAEAARTPTKMEEMQRQAAQASPIPRLDPRTPLPSLRFTSTSIRDVLNSIGIATGISVQYNQGLDGTLSRPFTVDLTGHSLESAFNMVLGQNQLTFKVIDSRTIFVYQDNQQERAKFEDQYQQTFYLSHADVGEVATILNQMLTQTTGGTRPIVTQYKPGNTIVVRASAPMLGLIKNIIDTADKPRAEVLIEVTILEVSRTRLKDLGIDLSSYALGLTFSPEFAPAGGAVIPPVAPPPINVPNLSNAGQGAFYATVPSMVIKFLEQDQHTRLLAKPQLRGREGYALTLNLGDMIPVPQTTFVGIATGGVQTQPQVSYQYRPVGVNISITPKVTYNDEIILDPITVAKDGLGQNIDVAGQSLPTFVTRAANVAMRLRDGESNLLAGLIREEDRELARSIPGINRIPLLRSIFGSTNGTREESDIVMLVTPHIIRSREITAEDLKPFYVGTVNNLGAAQAATLVPPGAAPPPPIAGATPPPAANPPATPPAAPANGAAQLILAVPDGALQAGGPPYNMPVSISNISQLGAATLTVTYDPKVLKVASVSQGSWMDQGGVKQTFVPKIDEVNGRVDIAITRPGTAPGVAGTNMLAGLMFQAVAPGSSRITVIGTALTPNGQSIPLQPPPPVTVTVK
jgi:general secretion pathway protein D